ncbi:glycosyltransferase family 2 protein [Stutzerimonas kirkiae]|uniref:Glycosyltransferase family 2 protein n=1 Tax=Stutzerimonas kirkiae TaxID=2211392 RepID=A0A4Q9R5E2_9GAMM|nr:glycosyltransferase family 2 protein [Stutzerimonas kirkiae]TBU95741.1 glycosyltransferase family 2 protein [Stutzerimonas kirkiae]TBV02732.1 glycosyltransferase family 2 protein [Stutzerimonas kirkiae]TBV12265.1 glycosyltransferase family 2 protein [Stutzerimonas kirkiae]
MSEDLISILIPAYNYSAVLPRAVRSVLAQLGDVDCELLVIDDGSTDATPEVVASLHQEFPGRFRSMRKSNGGLASVRNLGIAETRGAWLVFLDADDELAEGALLAVREHMAGNPETRMIIGGHVSVFEDGRRREHSIQAVPEEPLERVKAYLLDKHLNISNGACVMHRDVFRHGEYPEQFLNSEDIPVFAQVLAHNPVSCVDVPLAIIHKHRDSLRHNLEYGCKVGVHLVDEVFRRLPASMSGLRKAFYVQRCLSLFRTAYIVGDHAIARDFFCRAVRMDWRVLFRLSYTRKALMIWLNLAGR